MVLLERAPEALDSGNARAELVIRVQQRGVVCQNEVCVAPFSRQFQFLRLGGKGLRADGQRRAFQRVDLDGIVRPVGAFEQGDDLCPLLPALGAEYPQHFPVKVLVPGAVVQPQFPVDARLGELAVGEGRPRVPA